MLSTYAENLPVEAKQRYKEKLTVICGVDPFTLQAGKRVGPLEVAESLPQVDSTDLVSYLVLQTNFVTLKQFKSHKSLLAYNQFVSGWVKEVTSWTLTGSAAGPQKYVVTGRVRHSQRFRETPLSCWILLERTGEISCAHCNCMAGLGETCTHIAAVLFYLEAAARLQGEQTCTQRKCEWILPSFQKDVEYLPIKDIDFTSAKLKKRKLDESIDGSTPKKSAVCVPNRSIVTPSNEEYASFYEQLSKTGTKPAILSLIPAHSDLYVPKRMLSLFPQPLSLLHKPEYIKLGYPDLLKLCELQEVTVTNEMAICVEKETRLQSGSSLWFRYRAGRITASRMKAVCRTDHTNPSQSLVKTICYPESFRFMSKQTTWGCKHEKAARDQYTKATGENHIEFDVRDSGLVINPTWSFIGASPDGVVSCRCCGKGALEIKCPYCHRGESIEEAISHDKNFCLKSADNGQIALDRNHAYYYQVQTQLCVMDVGYCDFCLCTFTDDKVDGLHIERISKDLQFWSDCTKQAEGFFRTCILPELLGKWYTRPYEPTKKDTIDTSFSESLSSSSEANSSSEKFCYCRGIEEGKMIACDNKQCLIEWFHTKCLRITTVPKGKWYCPDCRKLPKYSRQRRALSIIQ